MRHALGIILIALLALPAGAQEQPSPPAIEQAAPPVEPAKAAEPAKSAEPAEGGKQAEPGQPAEAGKDAAKPADEHAPSDADTSADFEPPSGPIKPVVATPAQQSICLLVESAARANGLPVEFFARVIWQESRF